MIDKSPGGPDRVRRNGANGDNLLGLGDDGLGSHRHHGVKVLRRELVREVAEVVGLPGVDEREVGAKRLFQQPGNAIDLDGEFVSLDDRPQAGFGQHASQAVTAGPDPLGKHPLWYQFDLEFPGEHLPLRFWVGPDVRGNQALHQPGLNQLAERIRAGGYGLGGVLTKTGLGTVVERDRLTVKVDGVTWLLEKPLRADFALVNAWQADYLGNLTYQLTAQNFNPVMAMAAATVIAEAEEIVPVGTIPPDSVRTPGTLVDHLLERPA